MKQATLATLQKSVAPLLEQPAQIKYSGLQSCTVLTLCRTLYTLEYGAVVSKKVSASWAQETLGEPWVSLIERAWVGRHNPQAKVQPVDMNGTLDFIRYTLEIANSAHPI